MRVPEGAWQLPGCRSEDAPSSEPSQLLDDGWSSGAMHIPTKPTNYSNVSGHIFILISNKLKMQPQLMYYS